MSKNTSDQLVFKVWESGRGRRSGQALVIAMVHLGEAFASTLRMPRRTKTWKEGVDFFFGFDVTREEMTEAFALMGDYFDGLQRMKPKATRPTITDDEPPFAWIFGTNEKRTL